MRYAPVSRFQPGRNPRLWPRPACRYASGVVGFGANVPGVAFLQDIPAFAAAYPNAKLYVGMAFGAVLSADPTTWSFTDVSADVLQAEGRKVTISPMGLSDLATRTQPAACGFTLDNRSGAYSQGPQSSNYPNIKIDIPVIVTVNLTGIPNDAVTRFYGYAWAMTPSWDTTGNYAVVEVQAAGDMRRLDAGSVPLKSPVERAIGSAAGTAPAYHWRLDDAASATQLGSALPGGPALLLSGSPRLASVSEFDGDSANAFPDFVSASAYQGSASAGGLTLTGTGWTLELWFRAEKTSVADAQAVFASWYTDGGTYGAVDWLLYCARIGSSEGVVLVVDHSSTSATSLSYSGSTVSMMDGNWHHVRVTAQQNSGSVSIAFYVDGTLRDSDPLNAVHPTVGNVKSLTLGNPGATIAALYALSNTASLAVAHVALFASSTATDHYAAGTGYTGELTTTRFARLCAEERIPYQVTGTTVTTMGPQTVDTVLNLLRQVADAEVGLLGDGLGPGVYLVTLAARYNQSVALTLDVAQHEPSAPLRPVGDDQGVFNRYTVERTGGSSGTYELTSGPLGTTAIGTRPGTPGGPLNVASDSVLPLIAGLFVAIGTVVGYRYPVVPFDLRRIPARAPAWLAVLPTNRLQVTNVTGWAVQHPPETVDVHMLGWSESLGRFYWDVVANCVPAQPYSVGALDSTLRLDGSGITVSVDAAAADTSFTVATAAGYALPTTTATFPTDFPFDVELSTGERVTVTAIVGASSPQTFTVTRAVNGIARPAPAGTTVKLWRPPGLAL